MKQALLVIDFIRGIVETGTCAQYIKNHPSILTNTNRLIAHFREKQAPMIHIRLAFDPTYEGLPRFAPSGSALKENQKFLLDHPDTEFIDEIDFQEGDLILNKKYGDPFHKSGLLVALQERSIEDVILTGVSTDNAILFGANSAILHGFSTTIVTDAIGAATQEAHEQALQIMKGRVINQSLSTQDFLMHKI